VGSVISNAWLLKDARDLVDRHDNKKFGSRHCLADRLPNRNPRWIETFEAKYVDAQVVGRNPFPMKRVNAAHFAKEVARGSSMKLILSERLGACEQLEFAFVHLNHQRVLLLADRAVANGQLGKIRFDLKANRAAVTTASIALKRPIRHPR
jgi:hypothetical protein